MAEKGANVTWYDLSKNYMDFAKKKLDGNYIVNFEIGYLDDAAKKLIQKFDIVFCNVCFLYAQNEQKFAKTIDTLVNENGMAFVCTHLQGFQNEKINIFHRMLARFYRYTNIKIGHPYLTLQQFCTFFSKTSFNELAYYINEEKTLVTSVFRKNSQRCLNIF